MMQSVWRTLYIETLATWLKITLTRNILTVLSLIKINVEQRNPERLVLFKRTPFLN